MVKRPRLATASSALRTTSSAAAANSSCGVVSTRISGEVFNGCPRQLLPLRTEAQRAAPSSPAFSLVTTETGIDSTKGRIRPFTTNACLNNGPVSLARIFGRDAAGQKPGLR